MDVGKIDKRIIYQTSTKNITPEKLKGGFCVGWRTPMTVERHMQVLENSDYIVLAINIESGNVIGFITVITDHVQAAFIPLLEVLPEYQKQDIGSELVKRVLEHFKDLPAIDLMCDPDVQPFYAKLGMTPAAGMIVRNY